MDSEERGNFVLALIGVVIFVAMVGFLFNGRLFH